MIGFIQVPAMHSLTKKDFLQSFPFFSDHPDGLVMDILSVAHSHAFQQGQAIFHAGDECSVIAFLISGAIRVFKAGDTGKQILLYEVREGQTCILNAACIIADRPYPADAVAKADGTAFIVPAAEFRRLAANYEVMRRFIFDGLSGRLISAMNLVEEIAFRKMDERLRSYLMEHVKDGSLQITHQKIANDLGTSREVVSRLLYELERMGAVSLSRNQIRVLPIE
jgi:CRP/FNR family transcriptional regulator, anaerobic regulatory protein